MALSSTAKENISLKKLSGKSHTSNNLRIFEENKTSNITLSTQTIFSQNIPDNPDNSALYSNTNDIVEYVRLVATRLPESQVDGKFHAFKLSLPSDYEQSASTNAKKGTGIFLNSQDVHGSLGKLQLVPPSFTSAYTAKVYYGGDATKDSGERIPVLDERDWILDYFSGILFQENPPGAGDHAENPDFVEAFIYIGNMADTAIESSDISSSSIGDLSDVDITTNAPTNNQVLKFDGTKFVPQDDGGFVADTSTLWAEATTTNENGDKDLFPHGIIDGTLDTGMFAINLSAAGEIDLSSQDVTLHDIIEELSSINAYTPSTKSAANISDTFFEIYTDASIGEECIRPKE